MPLRTYLQKHNYILTGTLCCSFEMKCPLGALKGGLDLKLLESLCSGDGRDITNGLEQRFNLVVGRSASAVRNLPSKNHFYTIIYQTARCKYNKLLHIKSKLIKPEGLVGLG